MFEDVIQHRRRGGGWSQQWLTPRNLVELVARLGAHEPTAVPYGACTASTASSPSYGPEAERLKVVVDTLISTLGEEAFDEAKARGETLSGDEAVAFALAVIRRLLSDADVTIDFRVTA